MKRLVLFVCLAIFVVQLFAQEARVFQFDHLIESTVFGDERKITVYLPSSYYKYPEDKYTVTYVLDGQHRPFIDLGVKTIEYGTYNYKYTPTIVVGIHAKSRGREFTAPIAGNEDDDNYQGGRAPELQQHFKDEIFPLVDSLYPRTLPFRTLLGHSSGGGFVLYTLFSDQKDLFDAYIGISPGIRPQYEYILDTAAARLAKGETFSKFLYCSSGTVGEREALFGNAVHRLDSILQGYPQNGLIWRKSKFIGTGHWTCVSPSFNMSMVELTRAFRLDEQMMYEFSGNMETSMTAQIESFYQDREERYGFSEIPLPGYIQQATRWIEDNGRDQAALELYEWALKNYPNHYRLNKAKSRLLLKMGRKHAAVAGLQQCLKILEANKEKFAEEEYDYQKEFLEKKLIEAAE